MARPRSLNPSATALKRRAERSARQGTAPPAGGARPARSRTPPPDDIGLAVRDAPEIPSSASAPDAIRLRAIYDARKARLSSLAEALRLEQERRRLWTSAQVRARDDAWNAAVEDRISLVERLLDTVDGITPDQRQAFLAAARAWRLETKRTLASTHA